MAVPIFVRSVKAQFAAALQLTLTAIFARLRLLCFLDQYGMHNGDMGMLRDVVAEKIEQTK